MINWGTVPLGAVLPFIFGSYDGATGASEALSGIAVTDIEVYKGNSITQRSSDAGYALIDTDGIDIDGHVGINGFSIDTGDNTDAGFFVAGSLYTVVVASVTVDGQTVNFVAGTFRLCAAESVAGVVESDVTHFGGTAGTFAAGRPEVNTSHVAGTAQTAGDLKASLNTIDDFLDTEIAAILAAVDTETAAIIATLGVAGAGLTGIPWNAAWDAEVQSEAADALNAYDPPTRAEATSDVNSVLAILGTPAGASVSADIAAVKSQTAAIETDTGTDIPASLTAIETDTQDLQARTPAALIGGRTSAHVGAAGVDVFDATNFTDAVGDENAQRLMAAAVEAGFDVLDLFRALAAVIAGDASGLDAASGTAEFQAANNAATLRISAAKDGSSRTITLSLG